MSPRLATIGHVAPDVLDDGRRRLGGAALYCALAAQQLGAEVAVHTAGPRGMADAIGRLGLEVHLQERPAATSFVHRGVGDDRRLRVTSWAGRMAPVHVAADAVMLAPVADELARRPAEHDGLEVLLPQGLIRTWGDDGWVAHRKLDPEALAPALVVTSRGEAPYVELLVDAVVARGGAVAITDGRRACRWIAREQTVEVAPPAAELADDVGAGDVFGAALTLARLRGDAPADALGFAHATVAAELPRIHHRLAGL